MQRPVRKLDFAFAAGLLVMTAAPSRAAATSESRVLDCRNFFEILYLNVGLTLGGGVVAPFEGASGPNESGLVLGGEASLVYLGEESPGFFGGLTVDGVYDWSRHGARVMTGPVLGLWFGGIDGGYVADFSTGRLRHGAAIRVFCTVGVLAIYARYVTVWQAQDSMDFGLNVKLPLPLWGR
jgi:hypothetical protein